jgi:predicted nuclease of predicted toxin-antitoxin system
MKLLLDQGLPRSAALLLRERGINTLHVGEIGLAAATENEILQRGRQEDRGVVTLDVDFHALLAFSKAVSSSVVRMRIEGLTGPLAANVIREAALRSKEDLEGGALVTVQPGRIRIRHLPLSA